MQRFKNLFASTVLLLLSYAFYTQLPYFQNYFDITHSLTFFEFSQSFTSFQVFHYFSIIYLISLSLLYLFEPNPSNAKSVYFFRGIRQILTHPIQTFEKGLEKENKLGILTIAVKFFFAPLMLSWLAGHIANMLTNLTYVWSYADLLSDSFLAMFQSHLFWLIFQLILFADVFFYTLGYLIELPILKNKILSVEPTVAGWLVTLLCYPPFNGLVGDILPWASSDFPYFKNAYFFVGLNVILLILMGIYAWASIALGFKASNLTHRGIICKGPYRFVRHPAYICKNLAWWIGAIPALILAFSSGWFAFLLVIFTMLTWNTIYFLRALTEERHLKMVNGEYEKYMQKVPYRFVPGVV